MTQASTNRLMAITARPDIVMSHGEGSWLWDAQGRKYLDFVQGWAVNALGHCPPCVVEALGAQAARLITPSPAFYNEPALALSDLLTSASCCDQVFFTNSGAEANEGAIKLARKWGRKYKRGAFEIITTEHGFHGRTLATMSASGKPGWDTMFAPQVPGFPKARLNEIASFEALIGPDTVAIMLEPVQGEAGVNCAAPTFLRELRALADQHGLLLIFDEVQTGIGRLGHLFGYQHYGVEPDVLTLGKGLGGGVPLAALLAREAACVFEHGEQGGTYNGNPLMAAAGLAVVQEIMRPGFLPNVRAMGNYLARGLGALSQELGLGSERGIGLLRALELESDIGSDLVTIAREGLASSPGWENTGLLINSPRPALLRFMPALNLGTAEIDRMLDGLRVAHGLLR